MFSKAAFHNLLCLIATMLCAFWGGLALADGEIGTTGQVLFGGSLIGAAGAALTWREAQRFHRHMWLRQLARRIQKTYPQIPFYAARQVYGRRKLVLPFVDIP